MKKKKDESAKKITESPIYKENPFIDKMMGELQIKHKTQMLKSTNNRDTDVMLVSSDGEALGYSAFVRNVKVDPDMFAKLYISQLGALWDLKKPALKILSYLLTILPPNKDKILFDAKECLEYCGWTSHRSIYPGLIGLLNANIIARTEKSYFYYINPSIVFNGSRVTFVTTYVKRKKGEQPENQLNLLDEIYKIENNP